MKNQRKSHLINYSFQLKTAIPAVVISTLLFSILIGVIIYIASISWSGSLASTTRELDRAVSNEDNIVTSFKEYAKRVKDPIFILATEKIEADHKESIAIIKENIRVLKFYSGKNAQLLIISIVVMVLNAALLLAFLIRATHRAAGPVRVLDHWTRDLLEGRKPELRSLRKKDEFKEFYEDYSRLIAKYQKKPTKNIKTKSSPSSPVELNENADKVALLRINKHE